MKLLNRSFLSWNSDRVVEPPASWILIKLSIVNRSDGTMDQLNKRHGGHVGVPDKKV
jgi:hypothetical protein